MSLNASRGALPHIQLLFERRQLLQLSRRKEEEAYFADYIPPARDAVTLPRNVIYVLVGVVLVIVATYAIVGHLIKDLMHDLADWVLGPKPVEDESEEGRAEIEEEQRLSVSMLETDRPEMETLKETERDGQLPSFYQGNSIHGPTISPPLRSTITLSIPEEKKISAYNMSYCPMTPYVTSL